MTTKNWTGMKIFNNCNHRRLVGTPISTIPTWRSTPFCYCHRRGVDYLYSLQRFVVPVDQLSNVLIAMDIGRHVDIHHRYFDVGCVTRAMYSSDYDYSLFLRRRSRIELDLYDFDLFVMSFECVLCLNSCNFATIIIKNQWLTQKIIWELTELTLTFLYACMHTFTISIAPLSFNALSVLMVRSTILVIRWTCLAVWIKY